jgi:hypothetical protein
MLAPSSAAILVIREDSNDTDRSHSPTLALRRVPQAQLHAAVDRPAGLTRLMEGDQPTPGMGATNPYATILLQARPSPYATALIQEDSPATYAT